MRICSVRCMRMIEGEGCHLGARNPSSDRPKPGWKQPGLVFDPVPGKNVTCPCGNLSAGSRFADSWSGRGHDGP